MIFEKGDTVEVINISVHHVPFTNIMFTVHSSNKDTTRVVAPFDFNAKTQSYQKGDMLNFSTSCLKYPYNIENIINDLDKLEGKYEK